MKRARRRIRLIAPVDANAPVSNYAVEGLTTALERIGMRLVRSDPRAVTALGRRLARAGLTRRYLGRAPAYFRVLMGPSAALCFPRGLLHEIIPYCFDCVPPNYQDWKRLFQRYRISLAFFSAQQALAAMSELVPDLSAHWVPEAVDPSEYSRGDRLATRSIHILELGRRWDSYHDALAGLVARRRLVHLFEPRRGELVFSTREQLRSGLANAMISVCVPSSLTHSDRFGSTETVTHRYFESIASRCLIVGICPSELETLFGYRPMVDIDLTHPAEQLEDILERIDEYQELVDVNYARLLEVGTWDRRAQQIAGVLRERQFMFD